MYIYICHYYYCSTIEKQTLFYRYKSDNDNDPNMILRLYRPITFPVFLDCFYYILTLAWQDFPMQTANANKVFKD